MDRGQHEINNCSWVLLKIHLPNPNSSEASAVLCIFTYSGIVSLSFYLCCAFFRFLGDIYERKLERRENRKMERIM